MDFLDITDGLCKVIPRLQSLFTNLLQGNCTRDKQGKFVTIPITWNKYAQSAFDKIKELLSIWIYRAGCHNTDADALSRIPRNIHLKAPAVSAICQVHQIDVGPLVESIGMSFSNEHVSDSDTDHGLNMLYSQGNVSMSKMSNTDWIQQQKNDEILRPVIQLVQDGMKPVVMPEGIHPLSKRILNEWDRLHLQNGILYRESQRDDQSNFQLFLPLSLRSELLQGIHDNNGCY